MEARNCTCETGNRKPSLVENASTAAQAIVAMAAFGWISITLAVQVFLKCFSISTGGIAALVVLVTAPATVFCAIHTLRCGTAMLGFDTLMAKGYELKKAFAHIGLFILITFFFAAVIFSQIESASAALAHEGKEACAQSIWSMFF